MYYIPKMKRDVAIRRGSDTTEWHRSIGRCTPILANPTPRSGVAPGPSGVYTTQYVDY